MRNGARLRGRRGGNISDNRNSRAATAPAEGERRALRNLSAQYRVAAGLVREAMLDGELEWVRLVDPDAGRLDDVVIGRPGRLDAYQIKWSAYRGSITFKQLVSASTVSGKPYPAPFKLLADGWRALRKAHPDRVVRPHYLTHDAPSASDGKKEEGAGEPPHLQGFLRQAWPARATWHDDSGGCTMPSWRLKIAEIAEASGLKGAELRAFLTDCQLDLGFGLEGSRVGGQRQEAEVADLAHYLADRVARSSDAVVLTRSDLLKGLGWTHRFELAFRHEFPVDERLYRPVQETVDALEKALDRHRSGYLALVGPPGSGKSTTLTQTLRYRPSTRLARYYAFVRDDPAQNRGEAANFLRDLCLSLEAMLPRMRLGDHADDLTGLRARLGELLGGLHEEFTEFGTRTVVLVDGLDHIDREQDPERSLIHELPHPATIPQGVIFVLGTQPIGLEGSAASLLPITAHLARDGRTLAMARLPRASIRSINDAVVESALLGPGDHERVEELSAGHPLALAYLVKRLAACADAAEVRSVLDGSTPYTGEIEVDYRTYWGKLREEREVRDLLGLAARLKGAVELSTLETLASAEVLERFVATASHYFSQDAASTWRFFHNSFRQFVIAETNRNAFGKADPRVSMALHRRLAEAGGEAPPESALAWERVHHLSLADDTQTLIDLDHHVLFRQQFLAGRSRREIKEDLNVCILAAASTGAALIVYRLILIDKEIGDRREALEEVNLVALELPLKLREDLPRALMEGTELVVEPALAMRWAGNLQEDGDGALANLVFNAAEPLDILSGVERIASSGEDEDLDAWAATAWRFRDVGAIASACRQVRVDPGRPDLAPPHADEADAVYAARTSLITSIAVGMLMAGEEDLLASFLDQLDFASEAPFLKVRLDIERVKRAITAGSATTEAEEALSRVLAAAPPDSLRREEAARVADVICRLGVDPVRADPYLDRAGAPLVVDQLHDHLEDLAGPTEPLLRQARAMAARGRQMDPVSSVPDAEKTHDVGRVLFQRILVMVGGLWGEALAGRPSPPPEVARRLGPAIRIYRRPWREAHRWLDWHYARRAAGMLFATVLNAALAHGREAFNAVVVAFIADWDRQDPKLAGWSIEDRRAVAMAAFRIDGDVSRTEGILSDLSADMGVEHDLHDRISMLKGAVEAWTEAGFRERARDALDRMLATSFGIYNEKDDEIAQWARAAAQVIDLDSSGPEREEAASAILAILPILHKNHRGGGRNEAVLSILAALSRREPAAALACGTWLLDGQGALRSDVLGGLLIGQLGSGQPDGVAGALVAAARLLLPFTMNAGRDLEKAVIQVVAGPLARDRSVVSALERFRSAVRTRSQQDISIELLGEVGVNPSNRERDGKPAALTKAGGQVLGQAAVERLAAEPSSLAAMLDGATSESIDWLKVVDRIPARPDRTSFALIVRGLVNLGAGPWGMLALTKKAVAIGDTASAALATDTALARSQHYGWVRNYDGGSRRAAAECLVASDAGNGRRRALELLASDYVDKGITAREMLGAIEPILRIVCGDTDPLAVWNELRPHIAAVAEAVEKPAKPPAFADLARLAPGELPVRLLFADMAQPASPVAWEARRGLLDILRAGDAAGHVREGLRRSAAGNLGELAATLHTIFCLAWLDPALVSSSAELVRPHAWHEDAGLRRVAQLTLEVLDEEVPEPPATRPLPAIYSMQLPPARMRSQRLHGELPPPGEPLPDTSDPTDLTTLYHDALEFVSEQTEHSFSVLSARFAQLMREVAPVDTWSAAAEDAMRSRLESIELKVNMRRPRSLVAQHAFGRLVAELCDADQLEWPPVALDGRLLTVDPLLDTSDPKPRPDWLTIPGGKELGAYPVEDWLSGTANALPKIGRTPDGRILIAELTIVISLDRDGIREARASRIAHPKLPFRDELPDVSTFNRDFDFIGTEYPILYGRPRRMTSVVAGGLKFSDSHFIALNPLLGSHLGWQVSRDGLFRWVDEAGSTMVESICWHQGNTWLHDRHGMDESAAEGWLVVASEHAWAQLHDSIGHFVVHRVAGRHEPGRDGERDRLEIAQDVQPLPV